MKGTILLIVDYKYDDGYVKFYIPRKRGKFQGMYECLIDIKDFERIKNIIWNVVYRKKINNFYVAHSEYIGIKNGKSISKTIYLHNYIMNIKEEDEVVDHIKQEKTLDNRRSNLRVSKFIENVQNRKGANKNSKTGVRNVHWIEKCNEYWVQIMRKGERFRWIFPGSQFKEACDLAEKKRKELFGKFAGNG